MLANISERYAVKFSEHPFTTFLQITDYHMI